MVAYYVKVHLTDKFLLKSIEIEIAINLLKLNSDKLMLGFFFGNYFS